MTQLSDAINKHAKAALDDVGFDAREVAPKVWADLDDESRMTVGLAEIVRRLKAASQSLTKEAFVVKDDPQFQLPFQIDGAVSLDIDHRLIRRTASLTQQEFRRAIEVRRQQIAHDQRSMREWESAGRAVQPYWRRHPKWTFGRCIEELVKESTSKERAGAPAPASTNSQAAA